MTMKCVLAGLVLAAAAPALAAPVDLVTLYKDLHAHPELAFHELRSAGIMAAEARAAGFEVTEKVGRTGVVAVLKNGKGPIVLIRADMDALPVKEATGLPYASVALGQYDDGPMTPVMHACGHDIHMAVWIGTARWLAEHRKVWRGTVVMIGQPAEEASGGARVMLADGLLTRFPKPDFALALHDNSTLPAGQVSVPLFRALSISSSMDIVVKGVGGHGAYPHQAKDPVVLASQIVLALQTIVSREIRPGDPAVVTVGSIHGGSKHNIISDEVRLQLTLRSYTDEVRKQTVEAIRRICRGQAEAAGLPPELHPVVKVADEFTPALYNDPALTRKIAETGRGWFGTERVQTLLPTMGGEDFSEYGRTEDKIPICQFWLGIVSPEQNAEALKAGKPLPSLHSPYFRPLPGPSLRTAVTSMTAAVLELAPPR